MAALEETDTYKEYIYQLKITDPVIAGPNGISNLPLKQLASRTKFLKTIIDSIVGGAFKAAKAIKLSTPRKISLSGILSGYANFDGSADISLNVSIADGALSIAKTNGLQAALDGKIGSLSDASQTTKGIIEIATNAEAQAGADTVRALTPSGLRAAVNVSGSAPIFAPRAWFNFNGTGTVAIRASGNVSSVTDNGTGLYTVNFATSLPDANFACVAMGSRNSGATNYNPTPNAIAYAPSSVQLRCHDQNSDTATDALYVNGVIYR